MLHASVMPFLSKYDPLAYILLERLALKDIDSSCDSFPTDLYWIKLCLQPGVELEGRCDITGEMLRGSCGGSAAQADTPEHQSSRSEYKKRTS